MGDLAIRAEGVTKRYRIRHDGGRQSYLALRDVLANAVKAPFRRASRPRASVEEFAAVDNVSFDVPEGQVLGIIGRNGAGKSTLLKLLSRITEPTSGRITLEGRVASLLEVGTGFHPELTGRENIYLNGAILGMTRAEIERRYDEIVAFSEVERFLDTPVKRYSSGMYVRLAFAVAAHMEPEILIVDEVLAVGDAEFQKKCLGRLSRAARGGRTVLFVSHNMAAVASLCDRAILLERGAIRADGAPRDVVAAYLAQDRSPRRHVVDAEALAGPRFLSIGLANANVEFGGSLDIDFELKAPQKASVAIEVEIRDAGGGPVVYASTAPMHGEQIPLEGGVARQVRLTLSPLPLASGEYTLRFWLIKPWTENYHVFPEPLAFTVVTSDPGRSGFEFRQDYGRGAVTIPLRLS